MFFHLLLKSNNTRSSHHIHHQHHQHESTTTKSPMGGGNERYHKHSPPPLPSGAPPTSCTTSTPPTTSMYRPYREVSEPYEGLAQVERMRGVRQAPHRGDSVITTVSAPPDLTTMTSPTSTMMTTTSSSSSSPLQQEPEHDITPPTTSPFIHPPSDLTSTDPPTLLIHHHQSSSIEQQLLIHHEQQSSTDQQPSSGYSSDPEMDIATPPHQLPSPTIPHSPPHHHLLPSPSSSSSSSSHHQPHSPPHHYHQHTPSHHPPHPPPRPPQPLPRQRVSSPPSNNIHLDRSSGTVMSQVDSFEQRVAKFSRVNDGSRVNGLTTKMSTKMNSNERNVIVENGLPPSASDDAVVCHQRNGDDAVVCHQRNGDDAVVCHQRNGDVEVKIHLRRIGDDDSDLQCEDLQPDDLDKKKLELISSLSKKLELLRGESKVLCDEIGENECVGKRLIKCVEEKASQHETDKMKLHVSELEKIVTLLLNVSGRLNRAESGLTSLPSDASEKQKSLLRMKRDRLSEQHADAMNLKCGIDGRSRVIDGFLPRYLEDSQIEEWSEFLEIKTKLVAEQRELDEKVRLGEEQLQALKDSIGASSEC